MSETPTTYSSPSGDLAPSIHNVRRPASSYCMVVVSFVMSGIVCWMYYEVLKELGLSRTVSSFADYRVFTIASVIVLASPVLMLRRRPGWIGYLIGSLISFGVAAYFVSRVVDQVVHELAYWTSGPSIVYLSIGVLFALPFVVLFVRFVFGQPSQRFHGVRQGQVRPPLEHEMSSDEG